MYAAAGGASIASRQARQKQRQQNKTNRENQQKKLAQLRAGVGVVAPVKTPTQSKQFHQLPQNYLRTPNAQARKLSAGYTTSSKLLLPINEGSNGSQTPTSTTTAHHQIPHSPSRQNIHDEYRRQALKKSATASGPLMSQADATPPSTPTLCFASLKHGSEEQSDDSLHPSIQIQIPTSPNDPNLVTPATYFPPGGGQFERKCSVYRGRELSALEEQLSSNNNRTTTITATTVHDLQSEEYNYCIPNGGRHHHHRSSSTKHWTDAGDYCDSEHRQMGICTCDHAECAQGRAAWLERGRRCSVQENPASCHRRWVKRNRIHDSSLGGSSDDEDLLGVLRGPSSFANAFLYVGLGTVAIGLVIAFVGTGEKGFKTSELRLIGPSLIVIGLVCCILRILFCICPSHCISSSRRARKKKNAKVDADHTTSLLRGDSNKRVQIARGPNSQTKLSQFQQKSISKTFSKTNESVEALRQIATTSLFLQSEQKASTASRIVPVIQEPGKANEAPLEMKTLESMSIDIYSLSDDEHDIESKPIITIDSNESNRHSKLSRHRTPYNQNKPQTPQSFPQQLSTTHSSSLPSQSPGTPIQSQTKLMETSLIIMQQPSTSTASTSLSHHQHHHHQPHHLHHQHYHQQQQRQDYLPSTSIQIGSPSPSELVLSPAKLGQ